MTMANYNGGFKDGISIRGVPITVTHPGKIFWVSNSSVQLPNQQGGSNSNNGSFNSPYSTIAYALTQAVANRGDIIMVKPGHTETVSSAGALNLNVAGVAIVGLGVGSNRPAITLDTANTAAISIAANNVSIYNILFKANFLNIASVFTIANAQVATDLTIDTCEFRDNSAILNFVSVLTIGTTSNIADGLAFLNNTVIGQASSPAAATTAIVTASTNSRWLIKDNFCTHQVLLAATAVLLATGALNLTNSMIARNRVVRPNTDASNPLLFSTSGTAWLGTMFADNYAGQLSGATGLLGNTGTKASFMNNYAMVTGAADKSALINPAAV
jgi:hypothetical protein